ncbi:MAG TPA: hypothetical protein VI248_13115, partial [Kineosporiaceae bacterium]
SEVAAEPGFSAGPADAWTVRSDAEGGDPALTRSASAPAGGEAAAGGGVPAPAETFDGGAAPA